MYIVQLVFCYCSLARFTRRVLTQYLKDTVRGSGPPGSPSVSQPVPPASGDQSPKPKEACEFPGDGEIKNRKTRKTKNMSKAT
jgi:hypothetical protein